MTPADLTTTNAVLGIMAAAAVIEVLAVVGLVLSVVFFFRRLMQAINAIEERHVAPAAARVNSILDEIKSVLDDIKDVSSAVKEKVKFARWILDRIRGAQ